MCGHFTVKSFLCFFVVVLLPVLLSGCGGGGPIAGGGDTGSITGKAWREALDGSTAPLSSGIVSATGPKEVQGQVTDGSFRLEGLPEGTYRVSLAGFPLQDGEAAAVVPQEWSNVVVCRGTETVNVNFVVQVMPAPPVFN